MKKFISLLLGLLFSGAAYAGPMANVEYIHKVIEQQWGVTVPYNTELQNPQVAANMKYLLTAIDVTNKIFNGDATDYGSSEYATLYATDTIATNEAVERLVKIEPQFFIATTENTSDFKFKISAKGTFLIDWGDGVVDIVKRPEAGEETYTHEYEAAAEYTIGIGGHATGYLHSNNMKAAISFSDNKNIVALEGTLGMIFSIPDSGNKPIFVMTFQGCTNLKRLPDYLFRGLSGKPAINLFRNTFASCASLTTLPENLFGGISISNSDWMFAQTFWQSSLESIPGSLFSSISGAPTSWMFYNTFGDSQALKAVPENLFSSISGKPAGTMFSHTFFRCRNLTTIPENLFGNISGPAVSGMFTGMFAYCDKLKSPSMRIGEKYLYEIWPDATSGQVGQCYTNDEQLADWDDIPDAWK